LLHHGAGDAEQALELYTRALALRPADPLARDGLVRAAEAAGNPAPLVELVLAELARADESDDGQARADAYEMLARIGADLRGDAAAALRAYESAAAADPGRTWVLRVLERAYARAGRWAELAAVYEAQSPALAEPDQAILALERAHFLERAGADRAEILACHA